MRLIDADEAIERFTQIRPVNPKQSDYTHGIDVGLALAKAAIRDQKTIEPQCKTDEWCSNCKEYDQERHCCPRWNRVIRQTLKDAQADIIHCGECKHRDPEDHMCDCGHDILWQLPRDDEWYCADAEWKGR